MGSLASLCPKKLPPAMQQPGPAPQPPPAAEAINPTKKRHLSDCGLPQPSSPLSHDHTPSAATPASAFKPPTRSEPDDPPPNSATSAKAGERSDARHVHVDMQSGREHGGSLKRGFDTSFLSRDNGSLEKKPRRITPMATAFATHSQWESGAPAAASASPSEVTQKKPSETMQLQDRRTTASAATSGGVVVRQRKPGHEGSKPRRIAPVAILQVGAPAAGQEASKEGRSNGGKGSVATDGSENGPSDPSHRREEEVGVTAKRSTPLASSAGAEGQSARAQGPAHVEVLCDSAATNQVTTKPKRITPISIKAAAAGIPSSDPNLKKPIEPTNGCATNLARVEHGAVNAVVNEKSELPQGDAIVGGDLGQPLMAVAKQDSGE